jgi:hypothetical protein
MGVPSLRLVQRVGEPVGADPFGERNGAPDGQERLGEESGRPQAGVIRTGREERDDRCGVAAPRGAAAASA